MPYSRETILILDFGSQYTQLIARRIRESSVYCEIVPFDISDEKVKEIKPKGLIFSGGPSSVYDSDAPKPAAGIFNLGIPILGICYGMQLLARVFGGQVAQASKREFGFAKLLIKDHRYIFSNLPATLNVWMSHGDQVTRMPQGFEVEAYTENSPIVAMRERKRNIFGVQFHPEVVHTARGREIIANFLFKVCGCTGDWTMKFFIKHAVEEIKAQVGEKYAICGLSGGVDSSVAAVLVHQAIGDRLTAIFVNNGLLRLGEAESVPDIFQKHFNIRLDYVDASRAFLDNLRGVIDPELKRKIIGREFIRIFEQEAAKQKNVEFLVQGTLYPDVIESTSTKGPSAIIKTHHNVGGLPERLKLKLIEPFRNLFKDEVRKVGEELGLPEHIVWRQPFPGPGLAVRILGDITEEKLRILREADGVVQEEIARAQMLRWLWQSFAVLLPVKTVGVMGDQRTYENVIVLRAVTSSDGMTADWAKLPYDLLGAISNRLINEVKGVNRVVYDISSKPPSTIEWE